MHSTKPLLIIPTVGRSSAAEPSVATFEQSCHGLMMILGMVCDGLHGRGQFEQTLERLMLPLAQWLFGHPEHVWRVDRDSVGESVSLVDQCARVYYSGDDTPREGGRGVDGFAGEGESLARANPTARGSSRAPPSPGTMPTLTKLSANNAAVEAIRRSHINARSNPAPIAAPLTAAMVGILQWYSALGMR